MGRLLVLAKSRWLLGAAGCLAAYALLGFVLLPWLVVRYAPPLIAEQTKRQASLGAARFNPFLLAFEAEDFALNEADGRPIVAIHKLGVNFEIASLWQRAWVFGELALDGAKVSVVMDPDGKTNLARIADDLPKSDEPPPPPGPPPRFALKHFSLKDSALEYRHGEESGTFSPLNLELEEISTLPDSNGVLQLEAQWEGGGALHWDGRFALEPMQAEGDVRLEGFNLASGWRLVRERFNLAEPGGTLAFAAHYRFAMRQDQPVLNLSELEFKLAKLRLGLEGAAEPMLDMELFHLEKAEFDLNSHAVKLPTLKIQGGHVSTAVDAQGGLNWQAIVKPGPAPAAPPPATTPAEPGPVWQVDLQALKLADIALAYRDASAPAPFAATVGRFGLDLSAKAEAGAGEPKASVQGVKLELADLKLAEEGPKAAAQPLLTLGLVALEGAEFDLAAHSLKLPSWRIEKGAVAVALDEQGGVNWQRLAKPASAAPPAAGPPKEEKPGPVWQVELGAFKLAELGVQFSDASRKHPYAAAVGAIGLELSAKAEAGAGEPKAQVEGIHLAIKDISLDEGGKPLFGLGGFDLAGGRVSLDQREVGVDKIALQGGGVRIQRAADGTIRLAEVFAPKTPAPARPAAAKPGTAKPAAAKPAAPWRVALKTFAWQGFTLAFADESYSPPLAYDADSIDIKLANIAYPGKTPLNFDAKVKLKQGGTLAVAGKAATVGDSADAKVQAEHLNLAPLQPVVAQFAKLKLDSGDFSSNLQVGFRQSPAGPALTATGSLGLDRLLLKETAGGDRLLAWKELDITGVDFGLKPDRLSIKEVRFLEPGVKVAIAKDKSNNFAAAFKPQPAQPVPAPAQAPPSKSSQPAKTKPGAPGKPFPVKVERVRLVDGVIDFSDLSLLLPFATRVHDFDGLATDISIAPGSRSTLKFAGRVEQFGEAKVDGTLIPSAFKTFSDVKVLFRNVEMSSLSPYSATFAGRKITSGKLSLDLLYKIENSQLKSENKILLEQFTLGEQVESPGAVALPLDLAIALLKDGDGKIDVQVPITGDIDNPKFAVGPVLWDAFVTLIKTAVTSPFRAIGSMLGMEAGEDLGAVLFPAGAVAVPPPQREKIQKVATILAQRPQVKLTVFGGFDAKQDAAALKTAAVRRAVAVKLGANPDDAELEPLSFSDVKTQKALEELAEARGGAGFLEPVQSEFVKAKGRKPSRVSGISSLMGGASEDQDFYQSAFNALVEAEPLPANALEDLAGRRAKAVLQFLAGQPGAAAGRVAAGKVEAASANPDGAVPTRLELGAVE